MPIESAIPTTTAAADLVDTVGATTGAGRAVAPRPAGGAE